MKIAVDLPDLRAVTREIEKDIARATTAAMRETEPVTKEELRGQVRSAGLGDRLAKTWRGTVYPQSGDSMEPAGYVRSAAPGIIDSYLRGATIVPRAGRRFLAIPTDDCPRHRQGNAFTPAEVEARFGRRLTFINPSDKGFVTPSARNAGVAYLVIKGLVVRKATGRWRNASEREKSGKSRSTKTPAAVVMFTLVRQVKKPQLLDLDGPAARWAVRFDQALKDELA